MGYLETALQTDRIRRQEDTWQGEDTPRRNPGGHCEQLDLCAIRDGMMLTAWIKRAIRRD